jgi:hypothetical protein
VLVAEDPSHGMVIEEGMTVDEGVVEDATLVIEPEAHGVSVLLNFKEEYPMS